MPSCLGLPTAAADQELENVTALINLVLHDTGCLRVPAGICTSTLDLVCPEQFMLFGLTCQKSAVFANPS